MEKVLMTSSTSSFRFFMVTLRDQVKDSWKIRLLFMVFWREKCWIFSTASRSLRWKRPHSLAAKSHWKSLKSHPKRSKRFIYFQPSQRSAKVTWGVSSFASQYLQFLSLFPSTSLDQFFNGGGALPLNLGGCFFKGGSQLKRGKLTFFGGDSSKFKIKETGGLGIDMNHMSTTRKRPCKKKVLGLSIAKNKHIWYVSVDLLYLKKENLPMGDGNWCFHIVTYVYILIYWSSPLNGWFTWKNAPPFSLF